MDELLQIFGLSLIDLAVGSVTKRIQLPTVSRQRLQAQEHIPVVFMEPGELLVVDKPADLVINSNDRNRVSSHKPI